MSGPDTGFKTLFERTSDLAVIIDEAARRVLAANRVFAACVAQTPDALAGADVESLICFDAGGESATVMRRDDVGEERERIAVRVERAACMWDGRPATLCLMRLADDATGAARVPLSGAQTGALLEYLQEAADQLEVVNRVVAAVNSSRTIEEVFKLASEQIRTLIPFDRASIALREDDGERLRVYALSGEHAGSLAVGAVGQMRGSVTAYALAERRMVVIPELATERRFNTYDDLEREGFRSAVCCPLFSTHSAVGSLNLTSRAPDAYQRNHLLALERLAPPLALAIEKVMLLEQAERRSREMEAAARRENIAGRIGRQLVSSLDPATVLQETVEMVGRALDVDRCHIALSESDGETARVDYEYRVGRLP